MLIKTMGKRMKQPLSYQSMAHLYLPSQHFSKFVILSVVLFLCSFTLTESASVGNPNRNSNNNNNQVRNRASNNGPQRHDNNNYHFLDQHNEYDSSSSGVSILDDDTVRLSLAIDDDPNIGLSAPSLHFLEPKVYLRVSGESGMIRPDYQQDDGGKHQNSYSRASYKGEARPDLHSEEVDEEEREEEQEEDEDMNDNYHHHYPYIESYREKYVKPELHYVTTTTPSPPSQAKPKSKQGQNQHQVWSDIIAQVTTPSSFNEINSSASEHRLADFHIRANLPSYFYNKYSSYSEEDLENVADLDDEHSKYFVKTRPRSVTSSGSNIYSNFYYEPPSFSTKSVPIPVKTNKEKFVFASVKPTSDPQHLFPNDEEHHDSIAAGGQIHIHDGDDYQQDSPVISSVPYNFSNIPTMTPPPTFDRGDDSDVGKKSYAPPQAPSVSPTVSMAQSDGNHQQNTGQVMSTNKPPFKDGSGDPSTSQSITSKVSVNNPHSELKTTATTPVHDMTSSQIASSTTITTTEATTTTTDATSIPGIPGVDYPTLGEIPQTGFDCKNQRYKGFFADIDTKCQAWHYCDFTDGHSTFLCPNGTLFSQVLLTCDWWFNVDCNQARQLYVLNERLYRYIKPPKPSFPEDFIGEHVDKWLLQQLQMGLLPKVRKKAKAKLVTPPPPEPPTPRSN